MIAATNKRVPQQTAPKVNEAIRRRTQDNIARCAAGGLSTVNRRLAELDREWDIERLLEANAATASLVGLFLGATKSRKWFMFPAAISGFLLQHAVQGWCPPLPIFRRLGFRTSAEIDEERYALKVRRGDFRTVGRSKKSKPNLRDVAEAVRK